MYGDGDQSPFKGKPDAFNKAQFHRDIWCCGADSDAALSSGRLSRFLQCLLFGSEEECKRILEEQDSQEEKTQLLEKRRLILRHSAIFFVFVGVGKFLLVDRGGGGSKVTRRGNVEVLKLLCEHGARVDARDLLGKTVLHYAFGPLCTEQNHDVMMEMCDIVIKHAASLPTPINLIDLQDRTGAVAVQAAIMTNNTKIAKLAVQKWRCNVQLTDMDGCSPWAMPVLGSTMHDIINGGNIVKSFETFKSTCAQCGISEEGVSFKKCSRCLVVRYCGPECQKAHWKSHKASCIPANQKATEKELRSEGAVVTPFRGEGYNKKQFISSGHDVHQWTGKIPTGMSAGVFFDVKIQEAGTTTPMMVYNESRSVFFSLHTSNCKQFFELHERIKSYTPTAGRKGYFKAVFKKEGEILIPFDPIFMRPW
jgi:hypothetical protein